MAHKRIVKARSFLVDDGLSVTRISGRPRTPGNVGLALSGGGARSASSCMGVLRALDHIGVLRHIRAISSVSGGSWFSVPFTFLPERFDERAFLGEFVEDPGELRFCEGEAPTDLRTLQPGNFGVPLSKFGMSLAGIIGGALSDHKEGVSPSRLWTREIGEQLLAPFDLARFEGPLPADCFAANRAMASSIAMANPDLPEPYVVRESEAMPRPYLVVNGAMRVRGFEGEDVLAPVHFTPYFSGVMGTKVGTLGDDEVGGGGVSSYAFGGQWLRGGRDRPELEIEAPLALSDIAGISSAAYSDGLLDRGVTDMSPALIYASPRWSSPSGAHATFADAGSLENTAVANLLAYEDIDSVIAVVNAPEPVRRRFGKLSFDRQVAALFGYQEFEMGEGFKRYGEPGPGPADYAFNQVFSDVNGEFHDLVEAFGALLDADEPMLVEQELELVDNPHFGVKAGRRVRVLWVYLNPCRRWNQQLHPLVRLNLDLKFPNIPTARTQLREHDIALLAHFSSWVLNRHRNMVEGLFASGR